MLKIVCLTGLYLILSAVDKTLIFSNWLIINRFLYFIILMNCLFFKKDFIYLLLTNLIFASLFSLC